MDEGTILSFFFQTNYHLVGGGNMFEKNWQLWCLMRELSCDEPLNFLMMDFSDDDWAVMNDWS